MKASVWTGLAVLAAAALQAAAESPPWLVRTWQSDEGLPDNSVMGVAQTPDGFLWVATSTGLSRFDGVQFSPFPVAAAGVPAGRIMMVLADRRGRLWVAKHQGAVVCLDQGRATKVGVPESVKADPVVRLMTEDAEGAVWLSCNSGGVVRIQDGQARAFTGADGLPEGDLCQFAVDGAGRLWFFKNGWAGVFREGRFRPLQQMPASRIAGARSGGVWGYAHKQLWKLAEDGSLAEIPIDLPVMTTTALHEDRAGFVWLGTREKGLFRCDRAGVATVALAQPTILNVTEDREGNMWVGTRGGGLSQLRPRVAELLTTGAGIPFEGVRSVCQDAGQLWAVIWPNGEVMRSVGQGWSFLTASEGWSVANANGVAADPQGGVWIGTSYAGLFRWRDGAVTDSLCVTNGLGGNGVSALRVTASGAVWVGTSADDTQQQVLQCREDGKFRTFRLPLGSGPVRALATDASGDCWAATAGGLLLRVRGEALADETARMQAEPSEIRCLLATPDNSLWIGYGGQGLGRLKDGRFSRCRMSQGLRDDYISNMLPDGRGRLWLAGNRGISSVREKELNDFMEGRSARVWSAAYGRKEGMLRLQASCDAWPGAVSAADGRLLFAMQSGVAVVYAADFKSNSAPPPAVIERVSVNGKKVAAYGALQPAEPGEVAPLELSGRGGHLRLPPGRRQVEFGFTALSFTMPENIGFKYRLQGLDTEWVEAGSRRWVTYAQLPPGHYRFEVNACNSDGVWNERGATLELTAEPHWWETGWFHVAGPLAAAGLLGGWLYLWLRRRQRGQIERLELQQATERERVRIARDLHDDLGSGLTEIAMLSEVARQDRNQPQAVDSHLARIFQSSREMAQALDEIVWAVNPANDTLESLVAFSSEFARAILEPAGIHFRLEVPADLPRLNLPSNTRHQLCMALKECLHNILKHARASKVHIRIGLEGRMLGVTVADDGAGVDLAALNNPAGTCDGLANLRQRMASMGGTCEIHSAPGQGTRVELKARI